MTKIRNWTDREVNLIIKNNTENFLKDIFYLLDCEKDGLETNGLDISVVENIKKRIIGHFNSYKFN